MKAKKSITLGLLLLSSVALANGTVTNQKDPGAPTTPFVVTNLVSNQDGVANNTDTDLVNPWGIAQADHGPLWVSDNGTGLSTVYDHGSGQKESLTVTIPDGAPTGVTFVPADPNGTTIFPITENSTTASSQLIFGTEAGKIEGWSAAVDPDNAVVAIDNSANGTVYKGVSLSDGKDLLYAADFKNNWVEVYDTNFQLVNKFRDRALPKRFAPFNVRVMGGSVYVAYAEREKGGIDNVNGAGLGYVDVFHRNGRLKTRLVANGPLNAPWGMTIAPSTFGQFAGSLLVGNFGDGKINAFDRNTGDFLGTISDATGAPIVLDGLWGLESRPLGMVTFSSGPDDEANGLVGTISAATQTALN